MKLPKNPFITVQSSSLIIIVVIFAVTGTFFLLQSRAATPSVSIEPEIGVVSGPASTVNDTSASNGSAVRFGPSTAPNTPTYLQAIPGGSSIALIWLPSDGKYPATNYKVFRNGVQIGIATPRTDARAYLKGNRFNDMSIVAGTKYTYQVQAIGSDGQVSNLSQPAVVTPITNTTPVPTITVDTSAAPDLANWVNNVVVPELKVWYSKISDRSAYPGFQPVKNIRIVIEDNPNTVAYAIAAEGKIGAGAQYLRKNPDDVGAFIHEAAHVIHNGKNAPGWVTEGFADWAREYVYQDRAPILPAGETYLKGYTAGSIFLEWMRRTYSSTLIKDVVVATHNGTYTSNFFPSRTGGLNTDQLWAKMTGGIMKSTALTNMCVDNSGAVATSGNPIITYGCISGNTTSQRWAWMPQPNALTSFQVQGLCMDVSYSGTASGTKIWAWNCDGGRAQTWKVNGDGTITNPNSSKCLTGSPVIRTQFTIQTCIAADPNQKWSFQ